MMRAWKIVSGGLFVVILILIAAMLWQNQQVKKELIRDYILHHSNIEYSLRLFIDEYEKSQDTEQLADDLFIAYGAATVTTRKPVNIHQLTGIPYINNVDFLYEIRDQFDFYLPGAVKAASDDARDGELTEAQYQNLQGYQQLLLEFMELTVDEDFGEKSVSDFEDDFKTFYEKNEVKISELINN
ncbi:hypothetical protein GIW82_02185 [Planomicrobium sp. YIM 101495]|nr:hypothetical protein [Planomicrobium sp. YIM 101495]